MSSGTYTELLNYATNFNVPLLIHIVVCSSGLKERKMKILHITPSSNGYEEVELLANRINRKNSLALIFKNGQECMTGGHLINDTPEIRGVLDSMPRDKQYDFVTMFKCDPFAKSYAEE